MAGTFVGQLFRSGEVVIAVEDTNEPVKIITDAVNVSESETVNEKQQDVVQEQEAADVAAKIVSEQATQEQATPAIQFIENPLPLPKKHEKKVLDYAVELTDATAEFDIEVADDDDYDR